MAVEGLQVISIAERRTHLVSNTAFKAVRLQRVEKSAIIVHSFTDWNSLDVIGLLGEVDQLGLVAKARQADVIRDGGVNGKRRQPGRSRYQNAWLPIALQRGSPG